MIEFFTVIASAAKRLFSLIRPTRSPRECILSRVPHDCVCAELGVYKGDFSERILKATQPRKLHLVDPWKWQPDPTYERSLYGAARGQSQANMDAIYEGVLRRFRSGIDSKVVEVHRQASAECSARFPNDYFDWIYIDGDHQYEFVKLDLEMYLPKVKPQGLIAGDDYGAPGWWQDGVSKAVDEAVSSGRLEKLLVENHQFLLRKVQA
jgi:hypothetical protein